MASKITHPLEPLTADEGQLAVSLLKENRKVTATTRFVSVSLHEPSKEAVRAFFKQAPPPREAFAVLFDNGTNACHEAVLSLTDKKLRALELRAGMPSQRGRKGDAAKYSLKEVRRQELELAEQAERAYQQQVADWQARGPSGSGVAAANGTRLK